MASQPFEQVVQEHGPTVLRVCRSLLGEHEAQDAWAETFLSALRAYPELPEGSNVVGWLVTIAHRRSIDQLRVASRSPVPSATLPENVTGCDRRERRAPRRSAARGCCGPSRRSSGAQ